MFGETIMPYFTCRAPFLAMLTLLLATGLTCLHAAEIHVAPNGTPDGDGSSARPLDLATAISANSPAKPGDVIVLRGGQYDGPMSGIERQPFSPRISGTAQAPIVITSAPGQWAHINGAINIQGANYLHFVRLEIGDLNWDKYAETHKVPTAFNAISGQGLKLINCNIFGGAMGTGLWTPAVNLEAYGNLVHDFGTQRSDGAGRGHGHAFYMQNDEGTKVIKRNIAYRSTGWLYDIYTQQGKVNGFDIIENIGYMAGYHKPGQVSFSFGLMGWQPSERIRFIGNVAYQQRDEQQWRSNMRLMAHHNPEIMHNDAVVKDNYIMGSYRALVIGQWKNITVTGNTFWATGYLNEISSAPSGSGMPAQENRPDLSNYHVNHNTYYANSNEAPFIYGRSEPKPGETVDNLTFDQWQNLGLDQNSQMLPSRDGRPTGTKIFVFDNKYEDGRGNIAVFNWDGHDHVTVDLTSVLAPGQAYRIYNCLDIDQTITRATPVVRGTFDARPVRLPMRKAEESTWFDAFLVLPDWND